MGIFSQTLPAGGSCQVKMAVFSAIKNKKNRKLREGIEELANKFSVNKDEDSGVQYIDMNQLMSSMKKLNVSLEEKEILKISKLADKNKKVSRDDFIEYAKHSMALKEYLEKAEREENSPRRHSIPESKKVDKATAAFQAIDKDKSGFVDREEFLKFTSNLPKEKQEKLLQSLDKDGDGRIDLEEFRTMFNKK